MTPAAKLTGVSKLYGSFAALRNVTLELPAGRCFMVLGPNGAGKSTLLRTLAGLIRPTLGQIEVLGTTPDDACSRIGYMSHATMLYDELSALENLRYYERLYFPALPVAASRAAAALTSVGLDPALTRPVGDYSQGMRQRASMARALLSDPELLLLDEPFSNLDTSGTAQMIALLDEIHRAPRAADAPARTIVLTTHQPQLAESIVHTVITLRSGAVESVEERAR